MYAANRNFLKDNVYYGISIKLHTILTRKGRNFYLDSFREEYIYLHLQEDSLI